MYFNKITEMKKISLSIVLIFFYFAVIAQGDTTKQNTFTLQRCVETALANNLDVLQSQLQMQSSKIDKDQAKLNLFQI